MESGSNRLRWRLAMGFTLLAAICALAIAYYVDQAKRYIGADYTAMVADVVRAQNEITRLRMTVDSLVDRPDIIHVRQLDDQLGLIDQRMHGIRSLLRRSDVPFRGYAPLIEELDLAEQHLGALTVSVEQRIDEGPEASDMERLATLGMDLEASLAWAYSELNELLHTATAEQRVMVQRLSVAVTALLTLVVLVVGGLMLALVRIHRQRETLDHQSRTDPLTGLFNRRRMYEAAEYEFARCQRSGSMVSLVLIDLDHFKQINDVYGHSTGDAVLRAFSGILGKEVREVDVAVRMGGEEFAILMPDSDISGAFRLAERIRLATQSLELPGKAKSDHLTASLGVASVHDGIDHFNQLFAQADQRLYLAKSQGRNRTV